MRKIVALLSLCLTTSAASVSAHQPLSSGGLGDRLCGPDQLSGQYECVTSTPLSEEDVRVSMAHLARLRPRADTERAPTDVTANDAIVKHRASRD